MLHRGDAVSEHTNVHMHVHMHGSASVALQRQCQLGSPAWQTVYMLQLLATIQHGLYRAPAADGGVRCGQQAVSGGKGRSQREGRNRGCGCGRPRPADASRRLSTGQGRAGAGRVAASRGGRGVCGRRAGLGATGLAAGLCAVPPRVPAALGHTVPGTVFTMTVTLSRSNIGLLGLMELLARAGVPMMCVSRYGFKQLPALALDCHRRCLGCMSNSQWPCTWVKSVDVYICGYGCVAWLENGSRDMTACAGAIAGGGLPKANHSRSKDGAAHALHQLSMSDFKTCRADRLQDWQRLEAGASVPIPTKRPGCTGRTRARERSLHGGSGRYMLESICAAHERVDCGDR